MNSLQIKPYNQQLQVPYRWSKGTQYVRRGLLIRAEIDGHVGWGESALPPHVNYDGWSFAAHCSTLLTGLDVHSPDFLAELALREVPPRLRCGLSSALYTAKAASQDQSLATYLAGDTMTPLTRVPINDLINEADPAECVQSAAAAIARGQNTIKLKCTAERALDIARVKALRAAFPDLIIRLDPNESWEVEWALEQIKAMEGFNIDYIEEPLPRGTDLSVYAQISKQTSIPIALDDSIRSPFHALRAIELGAAKAFIIKPPRVGGVDETKALIELARAANIRCIITASLETSVGLYVALHCAALLGSSVEPCGMGTARFFKNDVAPPPPIIDGYMHVPETPGLGVDPSTWWEQH